MIEAKVIADSKAANGVRLTTLQVKFHRFILPEFNTHRVFSRNFSSSRAIPTKKLLEQVRTNPAMPVHWGKNQPGMQAHEELVDLSLIAAKQTWLEAARQASSIAEVMSQNGAHKQIVNRLIEPFLFVEGIVSSTEWDNFFGLRCHTDAQPEIQELAIRMKEAIDQSTPNQMYEFQWHLPYITDDERTKYKDDVLCKMSAARCCRVSYLKHDGTNPSIDEDLALCERLTHSVPIHASPFEHVAQPLKYAEQKGGNFSGWRQYRQIIEISEN